MFLIACEIERDYLPLLNGNITYYWTFFKYNMTTGLSSKRESTDTKNLTIIDVANCRGK